MSNYKFLHKETVLGINASGLLCRRRGAIKMLIELDLNQCSLELRSGYEDQLSR